MKLSPSYRAVALLVGALLMLFGAVDMLITTSPIPGQTDISLVVIGLMLLLFWRAV